MSLFELQPTKENLIKTMQEDTLERNISVFQLFQLINMMNSAVSISIDGRWGSGKTFFVRQTKMLIDAYNDLSNMGQDANIVKDIFKPFWEKEPEVNPQMTVYYDAWKHDNDVDPLISIVYEMAKSSNVPKEEVEICKKISGFAIELVDYIADRDSEKLRKSLSSDSLFKSIEEQRKIEDIVHDFMENVIREKGNRMVVFIDELDRCKPDYAIRLLERIKHYLSHENITFVFSVNMGELQHTVKSFYGNDFDAVRYLNRFFDIPMPLPSGNIGRFYSSIGLNPSKSVLDKMCIRVIQSFGFELREMTKYFLQVRSALSLFADGRRWHGSYDNAVAFCYYILIPIAIGLQISNTSKYYDFIKGNNLEILNQIVQGDNDFVSLLSAAKDKKETYVIDASMVSDDHILLSSRLEEIYNAAFKDSFDHEPWEKDIGQMTFNLETRDALLATLSRLSDSADYEVFIKK